MVARLSESQVLSLLADTPEAKQVKLNAWVVTTDPDNDAIFSTEKVNVTPGLFGKYEGKAGTMRRSRKGVARRMPNGRRYYTHPGMGGEVEVVAYLA